ncbi:MULTISPECIES: bifunctional metallophosphatase/5'-nucleotidase [Bacillus]|uniref:Bifunctional metallophosphatase/5'-nucleotidase n=1 Tax=Bacillus pumilus TaxID=1408 RepID=A0AAE3WLK9_BACPU|nr:MULTISPECIES: bifunctional UDP-sugar hydrolase/5'-nucleotidase [Bacillus]MCY7618560.1 bifunctional metallophosphatase/5'-nucleotidase [Bacillus pumilus]MDR4250520.1 bifunctional metallophosphatase/5'-nucleotidase [Bacillus pumilus]PAC81427.1 bifunctional metallophosphatase/5'-nucleotidase [Bacillus sp. 7788]PRS43170.1 bifunctional metallophosphatase/5'-nucleotidase [Bacillus sp. NMCC46]QNP15750.1 bifunctional metallophosphatase/5'-nucleotidase [Bacillus pumilus]
MLQKLWLYHTNDLHSHFENWPKIAAYIEEKRQVHDQMLLFDIGDHMDRVNLVSEADYGKVNVKLLNQLGYDGVTIGNNEGITLPHDQLDQLYEHAQFPVVLSNLFEKGKRPSWAKPYHMIQMENGLKICLLGVTIAYTPVYEKLGWDITDPFDSIRDILQEVKGQADVIVLLSHLGIIHDREVARDFPDIDIILGSHTHHLLEQGEMDNGVLLACAEKYGHYIGCVELTIDIARKELIEKKATVQSVDQLISESDEAITTLQQAERRAKALMQEKVTAIESRLETKWFDESPLPQLLTDAIKDWCGADIGMMNAGMVLDSLEAGIVTREEVHRICPHPINPIRVTLTGQQLIETVRRACEEKMEQLRIKGFGFRGELMGKMLYSGLTYTVEEGETKRVKDVFVHDQLIKKDASYTVGTVDMYTLGSLFPHIRDHEHIEYFMPEFLRDVLTWCLKETT